MKARSWVVATLAIATAFAVQAADRVLLDGSHTMSDLDAAMAKAFLATRSGVRVEASHDGTDVGIAALTKGTIDVAAATRDFYPEELRKFVAKYGHEPVATLIGYEGVSIYLHPRNRVHELSIEQLGDIFSGKIASWKEVGGDDAPIHVYSRERTTGKFWFMKDEVLGDRDLVASAKTADGADAMWDAVLADPNGIGYGPVGDRAGVGLPRIRRGDQPARAPTVTAVAQGEYPLVRSLYFFVRESPTGLLKDFLDFAVSPAGQKVVRDEGFTEAH